MLPCEAMSDQPPPSGPPGGPPRLQLQLDDDVAQGIYANLVLINHTENEFVLDFVFFAPGAPRAKVRSRIISSPRHVKRLLGALKTNLEKYEERFGPIEGGPDSGEPIIH